MLKITGDLINTFQGQTKKGKPFTMLQVLVNGGKSVATINITDWENRTWELKKNIELPIWVFPFQATTGGLGLNYVVPSAKPKQ